jgi:hypothetical protein
MDINQLTAQFTTMEEIKIFCASQMKQIQALNKRISELQDKLSAAEKAKKEVARPSNLPIAADLSVLEDAKTISQIQLNILKEVSFERELTTDEAKRVELYNRILKEDNSKDKALKATVEVIKDADLLRLVGSDGG